MPTNSARKNSRAATTKRPSRATSQAPGTQLQVRVRMYRQGLGDCFLLTFQRGGEQPFHMLIDCGVLKSSDDGPERIKKVVTNIKETVNDNLDLLVVTHEHWDHVSGFVQAQDVFKDIKVNNVWMAWTEDPENKLAQSIQEARTRQIAALSGAMQLVGVGMDDDTPVANLYDSMKFVLDFFGEAHEISLSGLNGVLGAAGSTGNNTRAAIDFVRRDSGWRTSYLKPGKVRKLPGVAGVRIYVLGPPENPAAIRRAESQKDGVLYELSRPSLVESFMVAVSPGALADTDPLFEELCYPFDQRFCLSPDEVKAVAEKVQKGEAVTEEERKGTYVDFFMKHFGFTKSDKLAPEWRRINEDWLLGASELALALDNATNNTSLALAIELVESGKVLLFPADAQVGNWLSWKDCTWTLDDEQEDGKPKKIKIGSLLERTVLYKVGHHGSHNATLRDDGLELMSDPRLIALIPVVKAVAKRQGRHGWKMPFPSLETELKRRTRGRVISLDDGKPLKEQCNLSEDDWSEFDNMVRPADVIFHTVNNPADGVFDKVVTPANDGKDPLYIECVIEDRVDV